MNDKNILRFAKKHWLAVVRMPIAENSAEVYSAPHSELAIISFARAIIAARDEELRKQEPAPKGFIVVSKDLLAEAIACNTDASLVDARHIINSVLKVSDDEIFREALKELEGSKP